MQKIPRSEADLEAQLGEQLAFLRASAESYDRGFFGEAKRLAHTLRVLLHDTRRSHSLLGQLHRKNIEFFDTAIAPEPKNLMPHAGLVIMGIGGRDGGRYLPPGDGSLHAAWLPFDQWWKTPVFVDDRRHVMSRSDLILTVANQDGGSHVDRGLDETYARLTRDNSMRWVTVSGESQRPVAEAATASVRQIAHEVVKSLDRSYSWKPTYEVGIYAAAPTLLNGPMPLGFIPAGLQVAASRAKVGRNDPCPCGSGKKYKKCHGDFSTAQ